MTLDQFVELCGYVAGNAASLLYAAALMGILLLGNARCNKASEQLMADTNYRALALGDDKQSEMDNEQAPVNFDLPTWLRNNELPAMLRPQAQIIRNRPEEK